MRRQVPELNDWLEQSLSNQMWQTVFKRLFSSIKQAACLCQLRVWKKTIQLKRPCMFAHTLAHTHTHLYAAPTWSILYCFVFFVICFGLGFFCVCNAAHATFFYFSHLSQNNTSPIILKYTHCCFQICWLPPVKRLVSGRGEKKSKHLKSRIWMNILTITKVRCCLKKQGWGILLTLCFKSRNITLKESNPWAQVFTKICFI